MTSLRDVLDDEHTQLMLDELADLLDEIEQQNDWEYRFINGSQRASVTRAAPEDPGDPFPVYEVCAMKRRRTHFPLDAALAGGLGITFCYWGESIPGALMLLVALFWYSDAVTDHHPGGRR